MYITNKYAKPDKKIQINISEKRKFKTVLQTIRQKPQTRTQK
jgi:hypothetical protein